MDPVERSPDRRPTASKIGENCEPSPCVVEASVSSGGGGTQRRLPEDPPAVCRSGDADGHSTELPAVISLLRQRVFALSLAALILYPHAVELPVMTLTRFGHATSTSILGGIAMLWQDGHGVLAAIVAICSVVVPLGKLLTLLWLAAAGERSPWRGRLLATLEVTGRWGMLDVLLVAVLVAAVKLGEVVRIEPGLGALAFAACVALAIVATATMARLARVLRDSEAQGAAG